MPALPQQSSCSATSTSSRPGIERSTARGCAVTPCACFRWHESWNATRSGSGSPSGPPACARSSETSTTGMSSPASFRCEPQPAAFVTSVSAPTARKAAAAACAISSPCSRRPAWRASAPQQPSNGAVTSYPCAASTRAVARLTSPKSTLCTQPVSRPTRARRVPVAGVSRGGEAGSRPGGASSRKPRDGARRGEGGGGGLAPGGGERAEAAERRQAGERERGAHHPRMRQHGEGKRAERALRDRPAHLLLDALARELDQPVVLHARRARRHACHAAEALVEVARDGRVQLDRAVDGRLHQPDPPARRVHLLVPELVRRARRQAEAAVHAVADQRW